MWKWHETERRKAAAQRAKAVAELSTVGISKRPKGGGATAQETDSLGLAIIVLKITGIPWAVTS